MDKVEFNEDEALIFLYGIQLMPELLGDPETHRLIFYCRGVLKNYDDSETYIRKVENAISLRDTGKALY